MGSNSSTGSSKSWGFTVPNKGVSSVSQVIGNHEYNNCVIDGSGYVDSIESGNSTGHKFYLESIHYYYKNVGSHRIIQLNLQCNSCNCGWYVYMDKTSDASKNINMSKKDFFDFNDKENDGYWTYWNYWIKKNKNFSYWDCLRLYHNAPSGYHITRNNCADFARYIWKNAPC